MAAIGCPLMSSLALDTLVSTQSTQISSSNTIQAANYLTTIRASKNHFGERQKVLKNEKNVDFVSWEPISGIEGSLLIGIQGSHSPLFSPPPPPNKIAISLVLLLLNRT